MARYRVQTASGRFYDVDLNESEDIESVVAEIERSEAPARSAGGGRGDSINPPMAGQPQPTYPKSRPVSAPEPVDYGDAATAMPGSAPADSRGLLQRIGDIFRPAPKTSVLDQPYTPTEQERQAEIDRRLSYGAGPVRPEMLAAADALRSSRITGRQPEFSSPANAQRAVQIAREMDRRGERSSAEIIQDIARQGPNESDLESAARQSFAKENPLLGSIAAGSAGLISGAINIPSVTADAFNEIAVNPVLRALGMSELPRVPTAFGTEYLAKAAGDFMPKIGKQEMDVAIKRDEFAPWLMSKLAANSPQIAQSLAAAFVPPLRAALLPGMAGTAAGQSFAQGDDSRVALAKGGVEYVSEKLPLGVFDKVGDVLKGMSPVKANTVLAVAGQRALQAGGAITANTLTNAIEETAAQLGGNVLDKYFQGKEIELTKGLAEAAVVGGATGKLMSLPQATAAATGYYEPERQIAREIDAVGRTFEDLTPADTQAITIDMLRTEPGTSNLVTPAATVANFTPPESPTKRAGMVDIEVPIPGAESAAPLGPINPTTEQQFGLDKLRMGGANVGTSGVPGGLAGAGGEAGGGVADGGLGAPGLGDAGAAGSGGGIAGLPGADDRSAVSAGGAAGQPASGLTGAAQPLNWTGRAKTGYASEQDAEQAMATASTVIDTRQTHDWRVEPMGNGRFQLVGYQKGTNLEATTTAAPAGQAGQADQAGQALGAALAPGQAAATQAAAKLPGLESTGLKVAPTAPIREITKLNSELSTQVGITVTPVKASDMNDQQKLASAVARLLGKTLTVVRQDTGSALAMPNGMINRLGGQHIYVAENTEDAPLFVATHEAYHGLPEDKRKALNTALLETFRMENKQAFLDEFSYDPDKFEEEAPAMMAQAISKREDFWQDLRTKMGNKEFGEVAKVILTKLTDIVTGAKKQYGEDFVNKYITDIARARDLLSTAYADAMQAQGLKPDVEVAGTVMASERSRIGMDFKDVVKRTPELQAAAAKVQAGEMTAAEYDKLVNETKPVEPYTSVPQPANDNEIRTALTSDKVDRIGVPSRTLKAGDPVGLRLDIPAYSNHGTWVVSVHQQEAGYNAGKSIGYEPVAAATNVTFGVVEKAAMNIAAGKPKATIAVIKGGWKPTTAAEAKLKADQALKSKEWVQVGMDPERHSYFYDRATMEPVTAADEVIQIGPLVLAKNPTYGKKSEFMFSNKARPTPKASEYDPKIDNFAEPKTADFLPSELVQRARDYITKFQAEAAPVNLSGADRIRAEGLLRPRLALAEQAKLEYDQKILDIASRTGAIGQKLAPLKGMKRAAEKLATDEGFNVDNMKDLLRSTIVVDSYDDAQAVVDEIRKEFEVLPGRIKNRTDVQLTGPDVEQKGFLPSGYGDVLINVRMPNGTLAEIQINTPEMLAAKGEEGHKLYEIERDQPEGSEIRQAVVKAQAEYYREAAAAAARRKNASSEDVASRGSEGRSSSSPVESSSLNTLPSGNRTQSSPEKSAKNEQPAGKEAGTFIAGSPDKANISQSLYADKSATKDEIVVDGVRFSSRQRDLLDVPTMEFKDLVDKKVFGIKADLMDAGRSYTGIDGSQLEFPVEMMGGPNYPRLKESQKHKMVWAVKGGAVLTKILKQAEKADYIIVHAMNGNSHLTNSTATAAYLKTVEAYLRDGRISRENLLALDEIVRSPKNKSGLPDFPGFESPEIYDYIDKLSFDQRGALAAILEKKEAQVHGLPNLDRFRRETLDPEYVGYRKGDAMLVIELDKDRTPIRLGENGTKLHPAYPLALRGRVVGKFPKGINYETIYRDYFQHAVPNFKKGEEDAWYSFDRIMPIQKITPQIASSVAPGGFTAIKTARQAEAALAMGNGNWLVSGKTKANGGVSVQEFVDALAANDGAAALTLYTAKEVNAGIKAKTFRVYQLGNQGGDKGLQIFFGLKRGRPWYADMIEGIGDNEVEVVSVTNNEPGAPGIGIPAIITKAISEGATVLDAFAVKSKRFPNGFLPEMYGQFGFEEIGRIPFDPSYYDANQLKDLKAFWSKGGWKESDGYPDVVVMRWKGKDEDRAAAVERYVRTGQTGVSAGTPDYHGAAAGQPVQQRDSSGRAEGGARGADRGQAGGDQGAGNAAPVVKRAYGSIQELATLSDGDIQNLGLKPQEIARLRAFLAQPGAAPASPTSGVQFSKRVSPADKIKWREITEVKREIGLDRLPDHIIPFADFMGTMATKAANGGLTVRDVIKAYTIARSSMNRSAVTTSKVVASGLRLPAAFTDAKIRPEGAFGYWLLSPMGQRYLNAAEVGITDQTAIDDAVKVMSPFGTQNALGKDLERAASGDLHSRLPGLTAAIVKASKGDNAVQDWQEALDNLYGVREAKKGFLGSLLGFGQLPTFDARQINVNVERETKEETLRALSSTKAREVVSTLAKRMDALSLTMDPKYAPFYQHLAHHAVWDAVGGTETTHSDVVESMLMASNRALPKVSPQSALNVDIDRSAQNLSRAIADLRAGKPIPSRLVIGRLPHVLNMLGARTQEFDIASSIVKKIFVEKHEEDFGGVNVRDFVRAMYRPAMVLKSKDGAAREYELVLPITGDKGAVIVPIKVSVDNTDPLGAVMSAYQKEVSAANNPKEMTVMRRINEGNLLYVDPALAKQAVTGRADGSGVKANAAFVSWPGVWPKIEKMISDRKVKTDVNLMGWIGDNYKPSSSPTGWQDAPAFSKRVAAPEMDKDVVSLFKDLQDSRGLGRIRVQERVDEHPMAETIRRVDNEFMDILERLDDAGLVKINCK